MIRYIVWFWWKLWYLLRPWPRGNLRLGKEFDAYMLRSIRVHPPWWKFKACVHRNDIGKMWQVYLTDEATYTERRTLELDCHISQDTGQVVGVNLFDEQLKYKNKEKPDA